MFVPTGEYGAGRHKTQEEEAEEEVVLLLQRTFRLLQGPIRIKTKNCNKYILMDVDLCILSIFIIGDTSLLCKYLNII
jgi:hypothetical protein